MMKDAFDFEQIFVEHTENNDHISDIQLENQTCYLKKFLPMNKDGLKDYDIINVIYWDKERHMVLLLCSWHNLLSVTRHSGRKSTRLQLLALEPFNLQVKRLS